MRSAIYEGAVMHHRREPVDHRFGYRLALPLLDLDEVKQVCALHPLWSMERRNVVSYRRDDFLATGPVLLSEAVRDVVEDHLGVRPTGPISLLAHLRTWGWLFNPIALYYCFDTTGTQVVALVAEVTNTPWHERHVYVVGAPGTHSFDKQLHVSPFFGMDHRYQFDYRAPGERLTAHFGNDRDGSRVFDATLVLERRPMSRHALGRVLTTHPLMTARVSAAIYRQAFALWRARVPFVAHPDRGRPGGCQIGLPTVRSPVTALVGDATIGRVIQVPSDA